MTPLLKDIINLAEHQEASDFSYLWAGLSAVATQLARKVYIPFGNGKIYPNLYVMFVGDPGKRKSTAIKDVSKRVKAAGFSSFCGDKVSMQKYLSDLAGVGEGSEIDSNLSEFNAGINLGLGDYVESYICQDEFSDFIGVNNYPFVSLLGNLWDIDEPYTYRTKSGHSIEIPNPIVNILGATTPSQFNTIFPPAISEQGFLSRLLIVNMPDNKQKISWPEPSSSVVVAKAVDGLKKVRQVSGEMAVDKDCKKYLEDIYLSWKPIPDTRFAHYSTRRHTQLLKLCMLVTCSRYTNIMTTEDIVMANTILSYTEHFMPQALGQFGKSKDSDVSHKILEFLHMCYPRPVLGTTIYQRVANDISIVQMNQLIQNMVAAEKIVSLTGGFLPKILTHKDIKTKHINWDLLGDITESRFTPTKPTEG